LARDGAAKLSEFRLGGAAKFIRGEAKFVIIRRPQVGWAPPTDWHGIWIMVGGAHPTATIEFSMIERAR
jgi:hypothetical protein